MNAIPWITEFEKVMGWHEVRDHDRLAKWLRSDGVTLGDPAKLPWCGDAVDTALHLALPNEPRPGDLGKNPYWALNWMYLGSECRPCFGAIAAFKRPSGGHVGILVGQSATEYRVLGGNQSDAIGYTWIAKTRCEAVRWPSTFKNPNTPLSLMRRDGAISTNEA
jgi:uncharacterized protein (TIGR02594 family)